MKSTVQNERIKRKYFIYLIDRKCRDPQTVDAIAASIAKYEQHTGNVDFRKLHIEKVRAFKRSLEEALNERTGKPLSASTKYATLNHLKAFFEWLSLQPGYKSKIKMADVDYFSVPDKMARIATARREKTGPSLEQVREVILAMPVSTDVERRNRALIAFTILTGARDGAIITFKLKHIDIANRLVRQDAREVSTKFGKTSDIWFFPVGDDLIRIISDWVAELRAKGFGDEDPLFPKTASLPGPDQNFGATSLLKEHWATAMPVRDIFRKAFASAGHPYANPHSFRNTLVQLAYRLKLDPERFKAWSQNLAHENMLTTFSSYGDITGYRQAEIMRGLAEATEGDEVTLKPDELKTIIAAAKAGRL